MTITTDILRNWYNTYTTSNIFPNESLFKGIDITFNIIHTRHKLGYFMPRTDWRGRHYSIDVSDYYICGEDEYRNTLLHEMCHLWIYLMGYRGEHHGKKWQNIADLISHRTGYHISRCTNRRGYKIDPRFEEKHDRHISKILGRYIIVVEDWGKDSKFVFKVSKNTFIKAITPTREGGLRDVRNPFKIYVSDGFPNWTTSRSFSRGYSFSNARFEEKVLPVLERAVELEDVSDIFKREFDSVY